MHPAYLLGGMSYGWRAAVGFFMRTCIDSAQIPCVLMSIKWMHSISGLHAYRLGFPKTFSFLRISMAVVFPRSSVEQNEVEPTL